VSSSQVKPGASSGACRPVRRRVLCGMTDGMTGVAGAPISRVASSKGLPWKNASHGMGVVAPTATAVAELLRTRGRRVGDGHMRQRVPIATIAA
jgi:hypothetical protein